MAMPRATYEYNVGNGASPRLGQYKHRRGPLLSQVGGKPTTTTGRSVRTSNSKPKDEIPIDSPPIDSSDEEQSSKHLSSAETSPRASRAPDPDRRRPQALRKPSARLQRAVINKAEERQQAEARASGLLGSTRPAKKPSRQVQEQQDDQLFGDMDARRPRKPPKTFSRKPMVGSFTNIHAPRTDVKGSGSKMRAGPASRPPPDSDDSDTGLNIRRSQFQTLGNKGRAATSAQMNAKSFRAIPDIEPDGGSRKRPQFESPGSNVGTKKVKAGPTFEQPPELIVPASAPGSPAGKKFNPLFSSSPLSSLASEDAVLSSQIQRGEHSPSLSPEPEPTQRPSVCPMCGVEVDPILLKQFHLEHPAMLIRAQTQFCRAHQKRTAQAEYDACHYPAIDWDALPVRVQRHHGHLAAVLADDAPSYYRDRLRERTDAGAGRTLYHGMQSGLLEELTPGYYGTRGAKLLGECVLARFSGPIRRRAPSDRLIAAAGVSGFVQAVLVPELATRLVMEDMRIDAPAARQILKASIGVGDLVNEEEGEAGRVSGWLAGPRRHSGFDDAEDGEESAGLLESSQYPSPPPVVDIPSDED